MPFFLLLPPDHVLQRNGSENRADRLRHLIPNLSRHTCATSFASLWIAQAIHQRDRTLQDFNQILQTDFRRRFAQGISAFGPAN